jgi:nickel/cobalt transporter (NiCoT) family protein
VAVALLIGTVELAGLLGQQLSLAGPFWTWIESLDLNKLGFLIVGLFVVTWAVALVAWRVLGLERRLGSPVSAQETAD